MIARDSGDGSGDGSGLLGVLLAKGADPNAATYGEYPGHALPVRRTPLMWYVHACDRAGVEALLQAGAVPDYVNEEDMTALDIAVQVGVQCDDVQALLKKAGAPSASDL